MSKALLELVKEKFPTAVVGSHASHGDETLILEPAFWHEVAAFLRDNPKCEMNMLMDLTAVDFPDREPRFEVVAHLYSLSRGHRLRLKARVGDSAGKLAEIDSLTDLWGSANWLERECFDMFGVRFRGHSDLRRILMYPEFVGHPLRKDYPADRIQPLIPFRNVPNTEKLSPFDRLEGMPFGRQVHDRGFSGPQKVSVQDDDPELFPSSPKNEAN